MEFSSRKRCIEHFQGEFPNLPSYMIEMALDYDLQNGGTSNEKPLTGKQKRQQKAVKAEQPERDNSMQELIAGGGPLEIDAVSVVPASEYVMPPFVKGCIDTTQKDDELKSPLP